MTQTDVCTTDYAGHMVEDFDHVRLGSMVIRIAGLMEGCGWESPSSILDYSLPEDPESQLLLDLLEASVPGRGEAQLLARARIREFARRSDVLDRIAEAVTR